MHRVRTHQEDIGGKNKYAMDVVSAARAVVTYRLKGLEEPHTAENASVGTKRVALRL